MQRKPLSLEDRMRAWLLNVHPFYKVYFAGFGFGLLAGISLQRRHKRRCDHD